VAGGYGERAPHPALRRFARCLWIGVGSGDAPSRVLPDGCVDVIWTPGRAPFVAGPDTRAKLESLPRGPRVGLRFRPGAAPALLRVSARELRDLRVPLSDLWPRDAAARLAEALASAADFAGRLAVLERAVLERAASAASPDPAVATAALRIAARAGGARGVVPRPADTPGERQLRRRFVEAVGYGPKTLERVLRFQRFLALARRSPAPASIAQLALGAGYADQSHLTRECTRLAGLPPAALLRGDGPGELAGARVSDPFKTGEALRARLPA
jgi:AraC-like DNA-binding protein